MNLRRFVVAYCLCGGRIDVFGGDLDDGQFRVKKTVAEKDFSHAGTRIGGITEEAVPWGCVSKSLRDVEGQTG